MTLQVVPLTADLLEVAGALVAKEQISARRRVPDLPVDSTSPAVCAARLERFLSDRHHGRVVIDRHQCVGLLCAQEVAPYAIFSADGLAVDPELSDATPVLVELYSQIAPRLVECGAMHHFATHVRTSALSEAIVDLGFGRSAVYATQHSRPAGAKSEVEIRIGTIKDLDVIAALSYVEMKHRFAPPMYAPPHASTLEDVQSSHARLMDDGAVHLLARNTDGDVGLLTLEFNSPAPRLCPDGQPYIGATATHPLARRHGIARALVASALDWAHSNQFETVSVDYVPANPLSRPLWLELGFSATGYGVARSIHASFDGTRSVPM